MHAFGSIKVKSLPSLIKFIKNAIEHSKPEDKNGLSFQFLLIPNTGNLKRSMPTRANCITCYRRQKYHLIKPKHKQSSNMHLPKVYSAKN